VDIWCTIFKITLVYQSDNVSNALIPFLALRPSEFPRAVTACTILMGVLYSTIGVVG
jgi:hypothetical protein